MWNDKPKMDRDEVWAELGKRNWKKVVISFSGGNDSGGADGWTITTGDDQQIERVDNSRVYKGQVTTYNSTTYKYEYRPATPEEIADSDLMDTLSQPIYDRYYSFAGEYEVDGTVTWDCLNREVKMDAKESRTEWDHHEIDL